MSSSARRAMRHVGAFLSCPFVEGSLLAATLWVAIRLELLSLRVGVAVAIVILVLPTIVWAASEVRRRGHNRSIRRELAVDLIAKTDGEWFALSPDGDRSTEDVEDYTIDGHTITFDWDHGITVPLWDEDGGLDDDPVWLNRALGLSPALVADLDRWGRDMGRVVDHRRRTPSPELQAMDQRAHALVARLEREIDARFTVIYRPVWQPRRHWQPRRWLVRFAPWWREFAIIAAIALSAFGVR